MMKEYDFPFKEKIVFHEWPDGYGSGEVTLRAVLNFQAEMTLTAASILNARVDREALLERARRVMTEDIRHRVFEGVLEELTALRRDLFRIKARSAVPVSSSSSSSLISDYKGESGGMEDCSVLDSIDRVTRLISALRTGRAEELQR